MSRGERIMVNWFVGIDSMVLIEDEDGEMSEEEVRQAAYWKILGMLRESEGNLSLLNWNIESEEG